MTPVDRLVIVVLGFGGAGFFLAFYAVQRLIQ